jgi:UDP:flavonoid glycosyltransferase YjiC (YdhE family)
MKIAIATEGTRGDVYPMLALAAAFRARGHEASVCASPDFADAASERGIGFHAIGSSVQEFLDEHARSIAGGGLRLLGSIRTFMRDEMELQFQQLPEATADADLIIGAGVQGAAGSCAELHRIPYRYVVYCPVVIPSRHYAPGLFPMRPLPRWVNAPMWGLFRMAMNLGMRRGINRLRGGLGLPAMADMFPYLLTDRPVIACDRELIELPGTPVDTIPCLHPFVEEPLPAKLESFLNAGPPPVYIGFGSMTDPDPATTTRTLLDAINQVGCRAILSEGWAGLGVGPLPEGVMTTGPCSHPALFQRVAAVVHHGGAGTTTAAARAGTPQILVPHVLDQYYWAQRVQTLGIGPAAVRRGRLTARALAEALQATLDNEFLAQRAADLGTRLRESLDEDPTAVFLRDEPLR